MANKIVKVTIKLKDEFSAKLSKISNSLKKFGSGAIAIASKVGASFLKLGGVLGGLAVAGFGALIKASVGAASSYETLQLRLEAVSGSAEFAEKRFKEIRKFAASTPLELEDLVKAEVLLKAVGAASQENLQQVAEVASVMGRSVEDVALAVGNLESETLKRFGIQLKKTGKDFEFNFRDKAGKALKVMAHGAEEAREALTDIFGQKFGGSLVKASNTIAGKWSTFKDSVKEAFATIGEQLLPTMSRVLTQAIAALTSLIGSGRLELFGKKIADGANNLIDWAASLVPIFSKIKNDFTGSLAKAMGIAAEAAGRVIGGWIQQAVIDILPGVSGTAPLRLNTPTVSQSKLNSLSPIEQARFELNQATASPGFAPGSIAAQNAASAASRITGNSLNNPSFVKVVNQNETGFGN